MRIANTVICPVFTALAVGCLAFAQSGRAACPEVCDASNTGFGQAVLTALINGQKNTAFGAGALTSTANGLDNTAMGYLALQNNTASSNTAVGSLALGANTSGTQNTAVGYDALAVSGTANNNTAVGFLALDSNSASENTAVGSLALEFNSTGVHNCPTGFTALQNNKTGTDNTATGYTALAHNTSGSANTAIGTDALSANTAAAYNTATGYRALYSNTTNTTSGAQGQENTANGAQALYFNSTGRENTALGAAALANNTTGSNNVAVGFNAGVNLTTGSNNIDIGSKGVAGESAKIRIGTQGTQNGVFIAGIAGVGVSGSQVLVTPKGKLGIMTSSARFKEAIKPMDKASEAVFALKPVTFRYKNEIDEAATPQFGLVAEEVEKINPALVIHDEKGRPYTVRYEAVNAMLLNEFLKEHQCVEQLQSSDAEQKKEIAMLRAELNAQKALIEKVNDKVELRERSQTIAASFGEK